MMKYRDAVLILTEIKNGLLNFSVYEEDLHYPGSIQYNYKYYKEQIKEASNNGEVADDIATDVFLKFLKYNYNNKQNKD